MTEYISPFDDRIYRWNLKDFEWYRIVTTGELPAYDSKTGHKLVDKRSVEYRARTERELATIEAYWRKERKSDDFIARSLIALKAPIPILPPDTEIFNFDHMPVKDWLFLIVFKMADVEKFETDHGLNRGVDTGRKKAKDKKKCRELAKDYVSQCRKGQTPNITECVKLCFASEYGKDYTLRQIRDWITDKNQQAIFPQESSKSGRRKIAE